MQIKSFPVTGVKAVGEPDSGIFEAIVSVFGNKDSYGDVVMPGAFTDTLLAWAQKDAPIPVYWSHRMDDPDYNIGHVLEARETEKGLWVKVQIDLDAPSSKADQVYRLLKGRRVTQFSFAYDVLDAAWAKSDELGEYYELRKLSLYEVGPTPIGANQETDLLAVKSVATLADRMTEGMKAGRSISAKNETELRAAHESIGRVLSALEPNDDQEKASGTAQVKDEEPSPVKSKEPAPNPSARIPDAHTLLELELEIELSI